MLRKPVMRMRGSSVCNSQMDFIVQIGFSRAQMNIDFKPRTNLCRDQKGEVNQIKASYKLIIRIWTTEQIPDDWRKIVICPVSKKGDRPRCENHWGLLLLCFKVLTNIIERRLRQYTDSIIGEYQRWL